MSAALRHRTPPDWATTLPHRLSSLEIAGWAVATCVVGGLFAGAVLAAHWIDLRVGESGAAEHATPVDLPPIPTAIAASDPAPDLPLVEAPDPPKPVLSPAALQPEPAISDAPIAQPLAPVSPRLSQNADLPPDTMAPPPTPPQPVAEPEPEPEPKPGVELPSEPVVKAAPRTAPSQAQKAKPATAAKAAPAASTSAVPRAATGGSAPTAASEGLLRDLKASWGGAIRKRIERRKTYPASAKGASGTVGLVLTVSRSGTLSAVSIAGTSGNAALDAAAIKSVTSVGRFPAAPDQLAEASYSFSLSITFAR